MPENIPPTPQPVRHNGDNPPHTPAPLTLPPAPLSPNNPPPGIERNLPFRPGPNEPPPAPPAGPGKSNGKP